MMVVMGVDGGTTSVTISIIVIIRIAIVILMVILMVIIIAIIMIRHRCWREVKSVTKAAVTDAAPRDSNE